MTFIYYMSALLIVLVHFELNSLQLFIIYSILVYKTNFS